MDRQCPTGAMAGIRFDAYGTLRTSKYIRAAPPLKLIVPLLGRGAGKAFATAIIAGSSATFRPVSGALI
jgi:hypothetical protein